MDHKQIMSHHTLLDALMDDQLVHVALEQDRSAMDEKAKRNMKRLYNHYIRSSPRTLATRFHRLDELQVPKDWEAYIDKHGTDPTWLVDGDEDAASPASALLHRASALARMELRPQSSCAIKNFHYLFFYDLVRQLLPKAKHTQKGLGPKLIEGLEQIVRHLQSPLVKASDWNIAAITRWYDMGFATNILATKFGPGYLFVLDEHISEDFLHKLPKSGAVYEEVIRQLEDHLGLPDVLEESIGELGTALRARLMKPFEGLSFGQVLASVEGVGMAHG
ncbi:uncharacterized protein N0V89_007605 [Didymosphaeria variabile]|uniref:Uncharacterized protein n=1 Tax=Didymosphaeria variabile TaxID=1932322 RepID=A0A9W8XJ57_9PLEO|nr:uncharacterized protein N0V89_007605 [Didymosphaeria variabile]KAJ4352258.1 hypothetical protein N0V89_007605 [Didymosphaeria variabile]